MPFLSLSTGFPLVQSLRPVWVWQRCKSQPPPPPMVALLLLALLVPLAAANAGESPPTPLLVRQPDSREVHAQELKLADG